MLLDIPAVKYKPSNQNKEELGEVLLHLAGYIGVPSVREAMIIANEVFTEAANT